MPDFNDNLVPIMLRECLHCGEIAQIDEAMLHLGCAKDHEFGIHPDAEIVSKPFRVQIIERI